MSENHTHQWSPITDLPDDWRALADPALANYVVVWREEAERLKDSGAYQDFLVQIRREWAIETGAIERLYSITEGASLTLIEKGLDAALIAREEASLSPVLDPESTSDPREAVVAIIRDQHQALDGLYQFITEQRRLTASYLKQLHQVLTANQSHCDAEDTLGNRVRAPLIRGAWKKQPNNIRFPDGSVFQFCPPEQVDSEIERLVDLHEKHESQGVPPEVSAAWLHHRFTLIHPFMDGNGRMARCLATLVMLKAQWFPLVVTRNDRSVYLADLRSADGGDLRPLVDLFGSLQRREIREAQLVSRQVVESASQIDEIIEAVKPLLDRKRIELDHKRSQVVKLATALHAQACNTLDDVANRLDPGLKSADGSFKAFMSSAGHDEDRSGYYRIQIVACAKKLGYFANLNEFRAWTAIVIDMHLRTELLFSFHGAGSGRGVIAVSAMVFEKERTATDDGDIETRFGDVRPLRSTPFELTYRDDLGAVPRRFVKWLNECVGRGLAEWKSSL